MQDVLWHAKTNCHMETARIRQSVPSIDDQYFTNETDKLKDKSNRKAMIRNWGNQKANPALTTKTGNKSILKIDKIQ